MAAKRKTKLEAELEAKPELKLALAVVVADYKDDFESEIECRKLVEQHKDELRSKRSQAEHTEAALRKLAAQGRGSALVLKEEVEGMRQRMGYEEASEIEKLLIERVILCWLRMSYTEKIYVQERTKEGAWLTHQEATDRQAVRANGMYIRSIDALNRFRLLNARVEEIKARSEKPVTAKGQRLKVVGE